MQQKSKTPCKGSSGLRKMGNVTTSRNSCLKKPPCGKQNSVDAFEAIEEAIYYAGRLNILADRIGISKAALHRGKNGDKVSAETGTKILKYLQVVAENFKAKERRLRRIVDDLREKL